MPDCTNYRCGTCLGLLEECVAPDRQEECPMFNQDFDAVAEEKTTNHE